MWEPITFPNKKVLNELLEYNKDTGAIIWKPRNKSEHGLPRVCTRWNKAHAGKPAFPRQNVNGEWIGKIFSANYKASHIIYIMVFGEIPYKIVHLNGDHSDNRLSNLKAVSKPKNASDQVAQNTADIIWDRKSGYWLTTGKIGTKTAILGRHVLKADAIKAQELRKAS